MEWVQTLQSFVTAVQQGSLSSAGRTLGASPASVSRHITSLEEQVGAQLLKRSSRSIALTEAGELYYDQVIHVLQQLAEANESVGQLNKRPKGVLRVHTRMLVGQLVILPSLPEFLREYPEIKIDLSLSNAVVPLMAQGTDIDIRIGRLEDSSLVAKRLIGSQRIICATPDYLARMPPMLTPTDLLLHNCLTYRVNLGAPVWRFMDQDKQVSEVRVNGNFQTEFGYGLYQMALAGLGVALLPDWSVRRDLRAGRLVHLLPEYRVSHMEFEDGVYAVFPKTRQTSAKLRVFVDYLAMHFRREQGPVADTDPFAAQLPPQED